MVGRQFSHQERVFRKHLLKPIQLVKLSNVFHTGLIIYILLAETQWEESPYLEVTEYSSYALFLQRDVRQAASKSNMI